MFCGEQEVSDESLCVRARPFGKLWAALRRAVTASEENRALAPEVFAGAEAPKRFTAEAAMKSVKHCRHVKEDGIACHSPANRSGKTRGGWGIGLIVEVKLDESRGCK